MNPVITNSVEITKKRLWYGFATSIAAWIVAGLLNVTLAWQACMGGEQGSWFFTQTGIRIVLGVVTFGLLAVAISSGVVSYRNWRALSERRELLHAEARGREEFMGLCGLIFSTSLAIGILWFSLPIYILGICVRGR